METIESILEFWFGTDPDDQVTAKQQGKLWWQKRDDTDAMILQRFGSYVQEAASGVLEPWTASPEGLLALIILTDQFPRNMYRETPQSFAFDHQARAWCKQGLAAGMDLTLRPIQKVFFYLPLEHSESLADQEQSVQLFSGLAAADIDNGQQKSQTFTGYVDYATRHRDIIARFGRFPHRNRILGRISTVEETAFLQEKGSSF
ncbi:DUF924 family protein [Undibacterium terreum]|uniref:DUF924 domain-containing protein n=1 Tax=Undibacterium terreum TaxID=1224302 RepID=A0A916XJA5_9BURK|nr:DUF924 family protein [Undibacterium terreum]GGC77646.1 hypothetical protein GCM10011396_26020 [Undibacterium terreum]